MARRPKDRHDKLYLIVAKLRSDPQQTSKQKQRYNFRDPTALRALRIHRHLRALENDIIEHRNKRSISLSLDPGSAQIVLSIRNDEVHCSRIAYLTLQEFTFLRKNRKVANILRKCPAWKDVA
ncbi:MAG TPA: hypothetical protein VM425_21940 [Myxococcota bacterium]|nr:hypothetical protein [Myxococcota bacterium]